MIGLVNYEAGNMSSVSNALSTIGAPFIVSGDAGVLAQCNGIILPGVGAAAGAMASLQRQALAGFLSKLTIPVLGICLGMQILYKESEEGMTACLAVLPGTVKKFTGNASKVPHMGWNLVETLAKNPLLGNPRGEYFYFAHSYYVEVDEYTAAVARDGDTFAAVVVKDNYFGVQFHPEKSGVAGLNLLRNFTSICKSFRR